MPSERPIRPDYEAEHRERPRPGPHAAFPETGVSICPFCKGTVDRMVDHHCAAMKPSQGG